MIRMNVLVLCGGPSNERAISLKTGAQIAKALPKKKYQTTILEITKNGRWLLKDSARTRAITSHSPFLRTYDVAFIGMHGKFGEDGKVQAILEKIGIPYTGSGVRASALGMDKLKTLACVRRVGIRTPKFFVIRALPNEKTFEYVVRKIERTFGFPCVVKPNASGSSIGVSIVTEKRGLLSAIRKARKEDAVVLVEQYIRGKELTCGVMGNTGQTKLTALPPVEIISKNNFFDYKAKYTSKTTKEICPARLNMRLTAMVQKITKNAHRSLGCDGVTRSDFILDEKNRLYFLEINTIPGATAQSLVPKEARAAGISFPQFLEMQIELALLKKK